jgi:acyl-CoA synthetase (AMP-forming)/AMP-acid ligase II
VQAGDAMPRQITKALLSALPGRKLYIMYGQTEASPRLTYLKPGLAKKKPDSIGKAIPGVKIKLVDKRGRECKSGERGEITAKGDSIMLGYWRDPKETKKVIKNGWLYTGDIAFKDKDGDLFIVGREKNFIKVGANRVDPMEIERLVAAKENIVEVAVIDIPDPILGSRLKMFISVAPGKKIRSNDIMAFCRHALPFYKVPSEIIVLTSMPKNSYGKIDKERLRLV